MTKHAQVVITFIICLFLELVLFDPAHAQYKIIEQPLTKSLFSPEKKILIPATLHQSYTPNITFGHILSNDLPSPTPKPEENTDRMKKIEALLEKVEQINLQSYETMRAFYAKNKNYAYQRSLLTPTPFIPIPTLIEDVKKSTEGKVFTDVSYPTPTETKMLADRFRNALGVARKTNYTIALLGDSMTETLGKDLPHLNVFLKKEFPDYSFFLLNYGQGATDLESGLHRLTNTTTYLGKEYPPLLSYKPDIIVIESFAYNHWSGQLHDLDRQWLTIAQIIDTIKLHSPDTKIVLAATIAPDYRVYGDGVLNWPEDLKWSASITTKAYLQNMINFATSEHYPLVNAYHPSMDSEKNGKAIYINQSDHLHPSQEGARLYSNKIVQIIKKHGLIK